MIRIHSKYTYIDKDDKFIHEVFVFFRQNLDLKGQFTDAELWQSLEVAQMKDVVANDLGGLG